jgi:glycolate oxidase
VPLPEAFVRDAAGIAPTISEPEQLATYECDALTGHRARPELVVLPATADEVRDVVRLCARDGVPFVARGAGTGLSGGALPVADGVVISLARMTRVHEIDLDAGTVTVDPGVTNLDITRAVAADGFYYAPDPSSQQVCTIGGNVAENSGGAHCLKHGFTVNHVVARAPDERPREHRRPRAGTRGHSSPSGITLSVSKEILQKGQIGRRRVSPS